MPWFRLEDNFHSHPKVIAAGNEATGLFVRCGTYAAEHLTDGFVPKDTALLYGSPALADTLVRVRLWHRARGGWTIHDYLDYNPSREAVENERAAKAERQKRWRQAHRRRVTNASGNASEDAAPSPSPPRPETSGAGTAPKPSANGRASPGGLAARAGKPPWCGTCDPVTRQRGDPPRRCPACHPLAAAPEGPP